MNYTAKFPSGRRLRLTGNFQVTKLNRVLFPFVDDGKQIFALDPRCIVTDESGALIYNPRDFMFLFDNDMFQWMRENPTWGKEI